jgi:hypothetical protein
MFCPKGKKKETKCAIIIIFIYKEFRPILLSGLKIESFQKCENGYVTCLWSFDKNFYVTSASDVYSKMMQYGTSTAVSFTAKKRCTKSTSGQRSREQKGLVTRPDSGLELKLYSKTTSLR